MKKGLLTLALLLCALLLSACGANTTAQEAQTALPQPTVSQQPVDDGTVTLKDPPDIDLSRSSETMAYAELLYIAMNPEQFEGQTLRLRGEYQSYIPAEGEDPIHVIYLMDQAACCGMSLEFRLSPSPAFSVVYPALGAQAEITGVLTMEEFEFNGQVYPSLVLIGNEIKEVPL